MSAVCGAPIVRYAASCALLLALLYAAPANAASKAWVSNTGVDSGTCGAVTSPCRTFQQAHDNLPAGGEIGVLTPGDYGPVTITKSVNITNDGAGEASVLQSMSGTCTISISPGTGGVVSLRGLIVDGQGIGDEGVCISMASAVHIQNCVIRNFRNTGVDASAEVNVQLFVSDTLIYNNGTPAPTLTGGVILDPVFARGVGSTSIQAVFDRVRIENNMLGIEANGSHGSLHVELRDSLISGNAANGVVSTRAVGSGASTVVLVNSTAVMNNAGSGILADGDGIVLLSNSAVEYNGTGASVTNSGRLFTYGNNLIDNNIGEDLSPAAVNRGVK